MEVATPFICSKCGIEFIQSEGGVCSSCRKPFFLAHLKIIEIGKDVKPVCSNCGRGHEKDKGFVMLSRG